MQLNIVSCEGGFYLASLETHVDVPMLIRLCAALGVAYRPQQKFLSLQAIKAHFEPIAPGHVWLEHSHAYDEMIGLPSAGGKHRERLYWYSEAKSA